jgi:hypothetical protein
VPVQLICLVLRSRIDVQWIYAVEDGAGVKTKAEWESDGY